MRKKKKYSRPLQLNVAGAFILAITASSLFSYLVVAAGIDLFYDGEISNKTASILCLASILLAFIISVLIMWEGAKHMTKPILRVSEAVKKVAEGDFSVQIVRPPYDHEKYDYKNEIDELSVNFNRMAKELDSMEYMRKDFMSSVSHEVKTPVAAITGITELLLEEELCEEERKEYLELMREQSVRLSKLCENMLNMSRLDYQQIVDRTEEVRLDEQIRQCIILLNEKWNDKAMQFELSLPYCAIQSNKDMLFQVWINVIDNAMKYSNEGSTIHIALEEENQKVKVMIRDEGIGIREEQIGNIFDKFYQCEKSHGTKGSGLGLSIVKRIMELLRGKIEVKSEYEKGTIISIIIPKQ